MTAGTAQESRLAIVIDTAKAEERIKELRKQLAELGGQSDETSDDLDNLGDNANNAGGGAENLGSASDKAKKSLDKLGKAAAIAGAALAGAIGLSINKAQSWETAMSEINKTVDFAAEDGLANMRKGLQELTTRIPQTFEELAAVTATGGQLGIAEDNLLHFTEVMAKMGVAFDIPAQQAADSMAKIANVFQIPIENIDRLGDAINTLSNNTPATAAQLIDSLQRVGGVAKVFGLSEDATLGLTGALIAMGKPAEVASTAVNSLLTTFSTLDNATKSQYIGFEQLGLNIDEFNKLVKTDGKQAIITYLEAINKLDQSERIGTNAMIIGKEFGDDITMLAGSVGVLENNWAMLGETVNTTKDYFGSMDVEFEKISATSANKMTLFKNNIDGVVASVGDAFIPALNDLLLGMTPMIATLGTWVAANPELIKQIVVIGGSLLGAVVGLKLAVDGFMAAKETIDGLKAAFTVVGPAVKSAFAFLTSGIGLPLIAIAALIAAGVLLYQNWDLVKEKASELNEWIKSKFGSLPEPLQQAGRDIAEIFKFIWNTGKEYLTLMSELYAGTFESFKSIAVGGFQVIWSAFKAGFMTIVTIVSAALQVVATVFSGGFALIKNTVTTVMDVIKAVISGDFKAIPGIIWNGLKAAAGIVTNMMGNILNIIKNAGAKLFSIGKDFIQGFINGIKSVGSGVAGAASTMVGNAIAAVKKRQDSASPSKVTTKLGGDFAKGMENGIKKGARAVKTEAQKMAEDAIKAIKDGVAGLKKEIALFGNNSRLAEFDFDVSMGKYKGASSVDISETRELIRTLAAMKQQADIEKEILGYRTELFSLQRPYVTELERMNHELSIADGKYKDATQHQKEQLQLLAQELDGYKMAAKARDTIQGVERSIALMDNGSLFAQWVYDLNDANNILSQMNSQLKGSILSTVVKLENKQKSMSMAKTLDDLNRQIKLVTVVDDIERAGLEIDYEHQEVLSSIAYLKELELDTEYEKLKTQSESVSIAKKILVLTAAQQNANKSVASSLEGINKEIALFGNTDAMAEFNYELDVMKKYAGASAEQIEKLRAAFETLQALKAGDAFGDLLKRQDGSSESPVGRLVEQYKNDLKVIEDFERNHVELLENSAAARLDVEKAYQRAKFDLITGSGEAMFGDLASMAKDFAGEQSTAYRALFAVEKGFAIAQSAMAIQAAVAKAMQAGITPIDRAVYVGQAISQGASIMSNLRAIAPEGFKKGGYTGGMGVNDVAGVVHGQEYVFDAAATKRIGVDNLNAMRSGKAVGGSVGDVNITVNVDAKGNSSMSGDTADDFAKSMGKAMEATAYNVINKELKQGGMISKRLGK